MEVFNFIHISKEEFLDYENKKILDYDTIKKLIDSSNTLENECLKLKSYGISNRKIAEMMGIGRNKVNKILKNCQ